MSAWRDAFLSLSRVVLYAPSVSSPPSPSHVCAFCMILVGMSDCAHRWTKQLRCCTNFGTHTFTPPGELVGTAEEEAADRTYLASLTEVERYEVLLEREYERNNAKKVWEFRQKKKESEREAASVASGGRRRGTGSGASKQKKALEKLQANRKRQKARSSRRGDDDEEDEWDDEEDEEDDVSSIDNDEE